MSKDSQMPTKQKKAAQFSELPILPVRDTVLFPNAILPLTVGRDSSLKLIAELKEEERFIGVVAQRDPRVDNPQPVDLYQIGTAAYVHKIIKLPSQSLFIFVEGLQRIAVEEVIQAEPYLKAKVKALTDILPPEKESDFDALGMPEEARKEATRELNRLAKMSPAAADYHVTRTYLDWLIALPWNKVSELRVDLEKAKIVLDEDHYDLEKNKERILDYLAVL